MASPFTTATNTPSSSCPPSSSRPVDNQPLDAEPIEPVNHDKRAAAVEHFEIIHRSWRRRIVINRDRTHGLTVRR